jgi:hypothetical protein
MPRFNFEKDPDARLDYTFDWHEYLADGETIVDALVTPDSGLNVDSWDFGDTSVIAWISGGTPGNVYRVACRITTSDTRTDERSINVRVLER